MGTMSPPIIRPDKVIAFCVFSYLNNAMIAKTGITNSGWPTIEMIFASASIILFETFKRIAKGLMVYIGMVFIADIFIMDFYFAGIHVF